MARYLILILALVFMVGAASATTITIPSCSARAVKDVVVTTDTCPNGLQNYALTFSVADPATAEITEVVFPSWATATTCGAVPAGSVACTATDGGNVVQNGDSCTLATVRVHSLTGGTTTLGVVATTFNNDLGGAISPTVSNGTVTSLTSARVTAAATFTPVSTQAYQDIYNSIGGNTTPVNETDALINWTAFLGATMEPYTLLIGQLAFVIIFAIPFVLMWLMHMDLTPAAIAGIIVGGFMLTFLPAEYSLLAGIFVVLAALAIVYSLMKERM